MFSFEKNVKISCPGAVAQWQSTRLVILRSTVCVQPEPLGSREKITNNLIIYDKVVIVKVPHPIRRSD